MNFAGFDRTAVQKLRELPTWGPREFATERARLADGINEPGAALIGAVAASIDTELTVVKRSSVSPLHRDLRFAPAGSARYKDHLLLTTWLGRDKKISPTLWIRIDSDHVGFASGMAFDSQWRGRWRDAVGGRRGEALGRAIKKIQRAEKAHDVEVAGQSQKRVPPPWDSSHAREDLLRMNSFQIRFREPLPRCIEKPEFARWCTSRLKRLLPVHHWLVSELASEVGRQ